MRELTFAERRYKRFLRDKAVFHVSAPQIPQRRVSPTQSAWIMASIVVEGISSGCAFEPTPISRIFDPICDEITRRTRLEFLAVK